jgi:rhamnose transport system ATP-binding protein
VSLRFEAIEKSFGATTALRGVTFEVPAGSAHALVGENGAGKSTLLKILAGLVAPDAGRILWHGRALAPNSPRDAIEHGIGMVYQEMLCFPNLSVAANIFAGREICRYGRLDDRAMHDRTSAVLARLSLTIDPATPAERLSPAHRQLLQVARALAFACEILVLDEPTTALTDAEADHLFEVLGSLRAQGTTILYVSHRLPEVFRLCDRITVLRDGALVSTHDRHAVAPADIVRAMVGRDLSAPARHPRAEAPGTAAPEDRVRVRGLSRPPHFHDVSFAIRRGEVVGLFGLVGSGRSELLETLFGVHQPSSGSLTLDGHPVSFRTPRDAACAGVALVPEERQRQGLLFNLPLRHNLVLPRCTVRHTLRIDDAEETEAASRMLDTWRIKASHVDALPDTLSGGNQQKVVIAKWLATDPRVLLLDEPTKGVDVGAKFDIHELIRNHAAAGAAVLVVSSDLPEVLALVDRVLVMKEGRLQGELAAHAATEESVMHLAAHQVVA